MSNPIPPAAPESPPTLSAARLASLAYEFVETPSVSGDEAALAAVVAAHLERCGELEVIHVGDNVIARRGGLAGEPVLFAGHLDTVPGSEGVRPASLSGGVLAGLGAVDMKGGLAVLVALATAPGRFRRPATFVFYAREEIARSRSGLIEIADARPDLLEVGAAVIAEPTGGVLEGGCQGVLRLRVRLAGARAHAARPWMGENAIHRLAPLLERVARFVPREPELDGCRYRESLEAVAVSGGVAPNVVPDAAEVLLAHRFAPDRSARAAQAALEDYLAPVLRWEAGDTIELEEVAPAAAPGLAHPVLAALVAASAAAPRAKLGWTDVAFFSERGVPAANFGPGDPLLAHTAAEEVTAAELERCARVLASLV